MKVSLKAKLTALISLLVLLVVLATSTLYLSNLVQQALAAIGSRGEYVANETYSQARDVLADSHMPAGSDPSQYPQLRAFVQSTLAHDPGLNSLLQSAIAYSPTVYYIAITDAQGQVLVHNDPDEIGHPFAPAPPFSQLTRASLLHQLRVVYGPAARVYEIVLPLEMGGQPMWVRVGVSTLFLRDEISAALRTGVLLSALIIVLATVSAGLVSFRVLRPLEMISRSVERWARGEYAESIKLDRKDEWGILSSKLNLLGEQMRGEKAAFVALKEYLDQLFSNLADGILLFDRQDTLVLATPAVSRFLDRAPDELVHRPAADLFSSPSPLDDLLLRAFAGRRSLPWQTVESQVDSQRVRTAVSVQFVEEQGERVGALVTLRDASTRARLEDQIEIAAKLAALGKITSGVAHEVKNPLNAMVLQVVLLKAKLGSDEQRVEPQLRILSDELRRLDRVVKTFLDFTRPVELRPRELDVETLVREVFALAEPQARQNKVELILEPDGAIPRLRVDPDLMKQALLNLVLNGCQAMPSGGKLKVTPHLYPDRLDLEIADQGMGIPLEARPKIFSLFFSTKPGGTGVGLAMAFRIVQLHNGSLDFASELDRGTTFRVSLPR